MLLDDVEVRVLGSLVEKESTTPEYYPLSLNALVNACNQKSNRDPLMNLDEDSVRRALRTFGEKGLAGAADTTDSRVTKYGHHLGEVFNFDRRETAILCVLLLRGPQTPGELRGRAERMHKFEDLSEVQSTLHKLMEPRTAAGEECWPASPAQKKRATFTCYLAMRNRVSSRSKATPAPLRPPPLQPQRREIPAALNSSKAKSPRSAARLPTCGNSFMTSESNSSRGSSG